MELFSLHDNVFHAAVLFYTFRIFDQTPSRTKFNPTIGYSLYEKLKSLSPQQRDYYHHDQHALDFAAPYAHTPALLRFFLNSLTFGPACVVDEFYLLFRFVLDLPAEPTPALCLKFIADQGFKFLNFNCGVLELLEVKTPEKRKSLRAVIEKELGGLVGIIAHTLWAVRRGERENRYAEILESEEDLFERGTHTKGRKLVKGDS